jgi:hypothetical protein
MRPTAELNYQLTGLDLPTERAHTTWQALQVAEQHTAKGARAGTRPRPAGLSHASRDQEPSGERASYGDG